MDEETTFFGLTPGCPTHGEEYIRECSMCGTEFCTRCFRNSAICPECAEMVVEEEDEEEEDEIAHIKDLLPDDKDIEKLLTEEEEIDFEEFDEEDGEETEEKSGE